MQGYIVDVRKGNQSKVFLLFIMLYNRKGT